MPGFEPGTSASRTLRANQAALHPEGEAMSSRRPFPTSSSEELRRRCGAGCPGRPASPARRRRRPAWRGSGRPPGRGAAGSTCRGCARPIPRAAGRWRTAMPPMLAICMSSTTRSGCSSPTASRTSWPRVTSMTCWPGRGARGLHQVADPLGVGGDEDRAHGGNASRHPIEVAARPRAARRSRGRRGRARARGRPTASPIRSSSPASSRRSRTATSSRSARLA